MPLRSVARLAFVTLIAVALDACAVNTHLARSDTALVAHRTYVVTGASSGFGRGVALRLGAMGANVVLAARRADVLEQLATEVRTAGGAALVVPTDVSRPEDVEHLAQASVARFGRIDVWVNNAGVGVIGAFDEVPVTDHARVIEVNLNGVIYGTHAALTRFVRQGYGTIVNVGSVESELPLAYQASYSASKHGVIGLGRALNEEMRLKKLGRRIKVVTVMPWAADTAFWQHAGNYTGHSPRMIMLDPADKVAEAIVWVSVHPHEELPVGWKAQGAVTAHNLFPDLSEHLAANIEHKAQLRDAPPAPVTKGAIYQPVAVGTGVSGGNRERIKQEDRARKTERLRPAR